MLLKVFIDISDNFIYFYIRMNTFWMTIVAMTNLVKSFACVAVFFILEAGLPHTLEPGIKFM